MIYLQNVNFEIGISKSSVGKANPPSNRLLKRVSGHQSHSQTVHWCLHGPQVQSDSRGCGGGTSWWSHPAGERSPLHLRSPQQRGGIGQSPAFRSERKGPLPREILLWKRYIKKKRKKKDRPQALKLHRRVRKEPRCLTGIGGFQLLQTLDLLPALSLIAVRYAFYYAATF